MSPQDIADVAAVLAEHQRCKVRIEELERERDKAIHLLAHMEVCRTCSEDGWANCKYGNQARLLTGSDDE